MTIPRVSGSPMDPAPGPAPAGGFAEAADGFLEGLRAEAKQWKYLAVALLRTLAERSGAPVSFTRAELEDLDRFRVDVARGADDLTTVRLLEGGECANCGATWTSAEKLRCPNGCDDPSVPPYVKLAVRRLAGRA